MPNLVPMTPTPASIEAETDRGLDGAALRERAEKRFRGRRGRKEVDGAVEEAAEVERSLEVGMAVERDEIDIVDRGGRERERD